MNLSSVREGDIVECDIKGRRFFAHVRGKDATGVAITPITRETWRHVTAQQVIGHYRKSKQGPRSRKAATPVGTFEARDLPEMIEVGGEMVVGPFCRHCGWPLSLHGVRSACPDHPNAVLGPSCDCHAIVRGAPGARARIVKKEAAVDA